MKKQNAKKITWSVTYSHVNEEEASIGETDRRGFIVEDGTLSLALSFLKEDMDEVTDYCFSSYPMSGHGWLSVYGRAWRSGDDIENSLHPSRPITAASWGRVMRLAKEA